MHILQCEGGQVAPAVLPAPVAEQVPHVEDALDRVRLARAGGALGGQQGLGYRLEYFRV